MKHAAAVQGLPCFVLERLQTAYSDLLTGSASFSLQEMFNSDRVRLSDYCSQFRRYPAGQELLRIVQRFGDQYQVWLPGTTDNISCAFLLYPQADSERIISIMKNLTVGFYMNDRMGRDIFRFLPETAQEQYRKMIGRMAGMNANLILPSDAHPIELANVAALREFRNNSPAPWFSRFLSYYSHHTRITHRDGNTDAQDHVPGVYEYIDQRCHLAGMHHIVTWIEYCDGRFLDWELLRSIGLSQKLQRLYWLMAAFGGLSNDLFSFEKEVIDHRSDSNLIAIIAINHPLLSLKEAIYRAASYVRNILMEMMDLIAYFEAGMEDLQTSHPDLCRALTVHFSGIAQFVKAMWLFQAHSDRYKRPVSIFKETRQAETPAAEPLQVEPVQPAPLFVP